MGATVVLPSGTRITGRALGDPSSADFVLLLGRGRATAPAWRRVTWPDFGVPVNRTDAVDALTEALRRARRGEHVEVCCRGGRGRTGTALAALAILDGLPAAQAVAWVRASYHPRAVETPWQRWWLHRLAARRASS